MRVRGEWPPIVPAIVLTEALTGDQRRDYHQNRLLRTCDIHSVDEMLARSAAGLRTKVKARQTPSPTDAIVVAIADQAGGATVFDQRSRRPQGARPPHRQSGQDRGRLASFDRVCDPLSDTPRHRWPPSPPNRPRSSVI